MKSAVLKKAVMAVTGIILFGWIFAHMFGNLKIFFGRDSFNHYAEFLREMGSPLIPPSGLLWLSRFVLLVSVGLHIWAATSLTLQNRRARPIGYCELRGVELDYAARTMRMSGYLLAVYVFSLEHLGLTAEIDEFFVLPSARGKGLGDALLRLAEAEFLRRGCTNVALQLGRGNDQARVFYRAHGYSERAGYELLDKMLPDRRESRSWPR